MDRYLLKETAPFMQFSSVKVTDEFNPLFDIEAIPKQTLEDYCQQLINRIFSISLKHIPAFIFSILLSIVTSVLNSLFTSKD